MKFAAIYFAALTFVTGAAAIGCKFTVLDGNGKDQAEGCCIGPGTIKEGGLVIKCTDSCGLSVTGGDSGYSVQSNGRC
ncbi:uncharacterized protein PgNI_02510 [Pyricularia grisea]|uniref:Uncharacterized protein n=1 Tax=Pyricularia grisea TaxID=148305 RepID=A0A6P8BM36_PYRGI|nr:uncharacterized protein PgNI_02510 [Pyricularia grisea]TLD17946.1 hypothetical protein PgNI_02510 [Pyricularia grisea]